MIKKRIFLSHTAQDKPLIERLAIALRDYGFEVWFDKWEIKVGDSIVSKINDGLHASDLLLVALSKGSVESDWVKEELNTALMRQLSKKNIQVLPALIEPCDIPPLLEHRRYADFTKSFMVGLSDLLDTLLPVEKFRMELKNIYKAFNALKSQILTANCKGDSPFDQRYYLNKLHSVMIHALSVRFRLEYKLENIDEYDLFMRLEFLQSKIDKKLQSDVWAQVVMVRDACSHQWDWFVDQHPDWLKFDKQKMDELSAVLEALCDV